jgi:hypothetical protein
MYALLTYFIQSTIILLFKIMVYLMKFIKIIFFVLNLFMMFIFDLKSTHLTYDNKENFEMLYDFIDEIGFDKNTFEGNPITEYSFFKKEMLYDGHILFQDDLEFCDFKKQFKEKFLDYHAKDFKIKSHIERYQKTPLFFLSFTFIYNFDIELTFTLGFEVCEILNIDDDIDLN